MAICIVSIIRQRCGTNCIVAAYYKSAHFENSLASMEAILRQFCAISLTILCQFCGNSHCDYAVAVY